MSLMPAAGTVYAGGVVLVHQLQTVLLDVVYLASAASRDVQQMAELAQKDFSVLFPQYFKLHAVGQRDGSNPHSVLHLSLIELPL